ncbi:ParM/StbA family protein [Blautia pseudococcoides]|nr:ParM/StbA family protein [Blautia pseudococcoides]
MLDILAIAVDTGNKAIKTETLSFDSGLQVMDVTPGERDEALRYKGKCYMPTSNRITYLEDKTVDERYFILTLVAIAKELEQLEANEIYIPNKLIELDLLVGLPPAHYGAQRKKFRDYFYKEGALINFEYMDKSYEISIQNVKVYIQGYAAYFLLAQKQRLSTYPKVLLIDIGGITVDYMILRYGAIDKAYVDSLEEGAIKMYRKVKSGIRKKYGMLLEETDVDNIICRRDTTYKQEVLSRVQEIAKEHVIELLGTYRELGIDFKTTLTVFSGGGSVLLAEIIQEVWERHGGEYFIVRDEKANAKGYKLQYLTENGAF